MLYVKTENLHSKSIEVLKREKLLTLIIAISLLILGIFTLLFPVFSGYSFVLIIGLLIIGAGILMIVYNIMLGVKDDILYKILSILLGALYCFLGYQFLKQPITGIITLGFMLAIGFMIIGVFRIIAGFSLPETQGRWIVLINGVLNVLISFIIFSGWPSNSLIWTTTFLGIEFLFTSFHYFQLHTLLKKIIEHKS